MVAHPGGEGVRGPAEDAGDVVGQDCIGTAGLLGHAGGDLCDVVGVESAAEQHLPGRLDRHVLDGDRCTERPFEDRHLVGEGEQFRTGQRVSQSRMAVGGERLDCDGRDVPRVDDADGPGPGEVRQCAAMLDPSGELEHVRGERTRTQDGPVETTLADGLLAAVVPSSLVGAADRTEFDDAPDPGSPRGLDQCRIVVDDRFQRRGHQIDGPDPVERTFEGGPVVEIGDNGLRPVQRDRAPAHRADAFAPAQEPTNDFASCGAGGTGN